MAFALGKPRQWKKTPVFGDEGCLRHLISVLHRGPAVRCVALQSSTPGITEVAQKYQGPSKEARGVRRPCEEDKWLQWRGAGGAGGGWV